MKLSLNFLGALALAGVLALALTSCGSSPAPTSSAPISPGYGGNESVLSWSDPLAHVLCERYGACGVVRILPGHPPVEAALVRDNYDGSKVCSPVKPLRCWWARIGGADVLMCDFGDCSANPLVP